MKNYLITMALLLCGAIACLAQRIDSTFIPESLRRGPTPMTYQLPLNVEPKAAPVLPTGPIELDTIGMRCPRCVLEGKRSTMYRTAAMSMLSEMTVYDEDGKVKQDSCNLVEFYSCSLGHRHRRECKYALLLTRISDGVQGTVMPHSDKNWWDNGRQWGNVSSVQYEYSPRQKRELKRYLEKARRRK